MPAKSIAHVQSKKAPVHRKPHPDFPLTPHPTGRWCKKVLGHLQYFGKIDGDLEGQAALALWLERKDELLAGRKPRPKGDHLTVGELCNDFLNHKRQLMESGELAPRTHKRYHLNCALLIAMFGRTRAVDDLVAQDFQDLRAEMAKRWGPVALGNEIQMARSVFRFGYELGKVDKPIRFGPGFKKPSAKTLRQARAVNGPRMFTPQELKAALKHATTNMKAMLLLAINGGLGNTDLALLPIAAVDIKGGWLDYARAKTAIPRRIPLWIETVKAVKAVLTKRSEPKDAADIDLLFIGRRGESYIGGHKGYRIHQEASRVFKKAMVTGRTFYDLRRTFQTIAEGAHDLVAVQAIMGHAPSSGDMSAVYRQRIDDDRLRAVVDHVHAWLFEVKK